jgi:hypothetical protein
VGINLRLWSDDLGRVLRCLNWPNNQGLPCAPCSLLLIYLYFRPLRHFFTSFLDLPRAFSDPYPTILPDSDSEEGHYEMVQAYHAVPVSVEQEDADNGAGAEHEGSALLGSRASNSGLAKSTTQNEGRATLTSSIGNLANTILGSGEFPNVTIPSSPFPFYPLYSRIFLLTRSVIMTSRNAHFPSGTFHPNTVIRFLSMTLSCDD